LSGTVALREKWPVIGRHEQAAAWLQIWTDLGRAPRTIDAYARGLGEYLLLCEREGVDPQPPIPHRPQTPSFSFRTETYRARLHTVVVADHAPM
jgi:hypothetical protein